MDDYTSTWEDDEQPKPPSKKDVFKEQVFEMWEAGIRDFKEIRAETGYSIQYIRQLIRERGYEVNISVPRDTEQINAIIADYKNPQIKIRTILRKWKISNNTLYSILETNNVPLRYSVDAVAKQMLDRAVEMYLAREPTRKIRTETGINPVTLYQELGDRGIVLKTHDKMPSPMVERAIEMYNSGSSILEIRAETGTNNDILYAELDKRGISKRRATDTEKRIDSAVSLYQEGRTLTTIYRETKVPQAALYRALSQRGIPLRGKKAQGDVELALQLYDKGESADVITRTAKCSVSEVIHALRKRGSRLRTGLTVDPTPQHLEVAIAMYKNNKGVADIELETGVNRVLLYGTLKRRGIEVRP